MAWLSLRQIFFCENSKIISTMRATVDKITYNFD